MVSRIKYMAHQIAQGRLPAGLLAAVEVDVVQLLQTAREHVAHLVKLLIVIHNVQIFFAVLFAHAHDDGFASSSSCSVESSA